MKKPDILIALDPVIKAFIKIGIPYCIGGSVASSAYGIARATLDVDLVADIKINQVNALVAMLESNYYIEREMIVEAIKRHSSCNLIHLDTMLKIDIFVTKDRPFDQAVFQRKRKETLDEKHTTDEFYLTSPEDVILNKLEWFRMGEESSERQWHDVIGIIQVQGESLDKNYLHHWALELKVLDLLERAFRDAGV